MREKSFWEFETIQKYAEDKLQLVGVLAHNNCCRPNFTNLIKLNIFLCPAPVD